MKLKSQAQMGWIDSLVDSVLGFGPEVDSQFDKNYVFHPPDSFSVMEIKLGSQAQIMTRVSMFANSKAQPKRYACSLMLYEYRAKTAEDKAKSFGI